MTVIPRLPPATVTIMMQACGPAFFAAAAAGPGPALLGNFRVWHRSSVTFQVEAEMMVVNLPNSGGSRASES
jgi:hypothetical protein